MWHQILAGCAVILFAIEFSRSKSLAAAGLTLLAASLVF